MEVHTWTVMVSPFSCACTASLTSASTSSTFNLCSANKVKHCFVKKKFKKNAMFLDSSPIKNPRPTTEYINSPSSHLHTQYILTKKYYKFKPHASACISKLHCKIFIINDFLCQVFCLHVIRTLC